MKYIILAILILSTLISSGCHFSLLDGGYVDNKPNQSFKLGSISTDILMDNAVNDFDDKQRVEEYLKEQGLIFGIRFERRF